MTAILGRLLVLPPILVAPEGATEHVRNALAILRALEHNHPGVWASAPELQQGERRAQFALTFLETHAHYPPTVHAQLHLRRAVEALASAPVDWELVPDVEAACLRLVRAFLLL